MGVEQFENKKNSQKIFEHVAYGYRASNGSLLKDNNKTQWWTSNEYDKKQSYITEIDIANIDMKQRPLDKNKGVPIICVKVQIKRNDKMD